MRKYFQCKTLLGRWAYMGKIIFNISILFIKANRKQNASQHLISMTEFKVEISQFSIHSEFWWMSCPLPVGGSKGKSCYWGCKERGSYARGRSKRHPWVLAHHIQECGHAQWHATSMFQWFVFNSCLMYISPQFWAILDVSDLTVSLIRNMMSPS